MVTSCTEVTGIGVHLVVGPLTGVTVAVVTIGARGAAVVELDGSGGTDEDGGSVDDVGAGAGEDVGVYKLVVSVGSPIYFKNTPSKEASYMCNDGN